MTWRLGDRIAGRINRTLEKRYTLQAIDTTAVTDRIYAVKTDTANFYVCQCSAGIACIDTGYRPLVIREQMKSLGIDTDAVTHVFLTHADIDHTGGLRVFRNAEIYLSALEEPMFKGIRPPTRAFRTPRIRRAYHLLREGDIVRVGDSEIRAIETRAIRRAPWRIFWTARISLWATPVSLGRAGLRRKALHHGLRNPEGFYTQAVRAGKHPIRVHGTQRLYSGFWKDVRLLAHGAGSEGGAGGGGHHAVPGNG